MDGWIGGWTEELYPLNWGFPGGSVVKNLPAIQDTQVRSPGQEDPLEKEMTTDSSILAWRTPWTQEPDGLQYMGSQRVGLNSLSNFQLTAQDWGSSVATWIEHLTDTQLEKRPHCCYFRLGLFFFTAAGSFSPNRSVAHAQECWPWLPWELPFHSSVRSMTFRHGPVSWSSLARVKGKATLSLFFFLVI